MSESEKYLELIEKRWNEIGFCDTCGWHSLFSEHYVDEYDIKEALADNGKMELSCLSDFQDDHKGVRFNLHDLPHLRKVNKV